MKEDMLFILDIIISRTKGVNTESKLSHAANDIMGEVKEHEERTTDDRSSIYCCALLGVCWKKMPGPEVHHKMTEMNGLTIQQL
eukprot:390226-Pelagomonas_calceolata.AAC.1